MKILSQRKRYWGGMIVLTLGTTLLLSAAVINGPDYDSTFEREVLSEVDPEALRFALDHVDQWPQWFFSMKEARVVDRNGNPLSIKDQVPMPGAKIRLHFDPKKGEHRRFDLVVRILEYHPGHSVRLRVELDSTGRLTQLFSKIEWSIEIVSQNSEMGTQSMLRGSQVVTTRHWRSRFLTRIARRIVLNQLFYPDLIRLSRITQPRDPKGLSAMDH